MIFRILPFVFGAALETLEQENRVREMRKRKTERGRTNGIRI
ncbi:uncharacterized protein G2W53_008512 [Senna tora]|uniref:Uncharacterized protein n=1 Tax=Senna tora TaxID=362788 RepID=A0A835CH46_9FABA|nr:uncharacterized protein G2W53_008504 [Senna tora]KAF7840030.1 uncharacterized protein G2W53_008512 [Senna tora]